jgi:hypothetical protein
LISFRMYSDIIIQIIQNKGEISVVNYSESPLLISLIYIMMDLRDKYQDTLSKIEIKDIPENSIEYYLFLEGRIRYLLLTERKNIINKKQNDLTLEFSSLCNKALGMYEYSFNATVGLAEQQFVRKQYSDSVNMLCKLFNFGYKSDGILDLLISYAIGLKDWNTYKNYVTYIKSRAYRIFLESTYFDFRFFVIRIPYTLFCFFIAPMLGWNLTLVIILPINILIMILILKFKRRVSFMFGPYFFLTLLIASFFWLFYMK